MKIYILFFLLSVNLLVSQNNYKISDTSKVGVLKSFQDTTEVNYFLKISNEEKANKKFRIYYDGKKQKLASEFNCDNKGLIDTLKEWYRDGQIKQIYYSRKNGNGDLWEGVKRYENYQLKLYRKCINDTCITFTYYDNGKLKSLLNEKGANLFFIEEYYKNGQKKFEPHAVDWLTKRHEILYYENGKVLQDRFWLSYSLVDGFKEYYDNGKLKITGQYESEEQYRTATKVQYRNAYKIGKWIYYNISGKLEKEELYDDDVVTKTINY